MVAENVRTESAENISQIAQLESDMHDLRSMVAFSERCNNISEGRKS